MGSGAGSACRVYMAENGKPDNDTKRVPDQKVFDVRTLDDVLASIRRTSGTGKLVINVRDGHARGEAKWRGWVLRQ